LHWNRRDSFCIWKRRWNSSKKTSEQVILSITKNSRLVGGSVLLIKVFKPLGRIFGQFRVIFDQTYLSSHQGQLFTCMNQVNTCSWIVFEFEISLFSFHCPLIELKKGIIFQPLNIRVEYLYGPGKWFRYYILLSWKEACLK